MPPKQAYVLIYILSNIEIDMLYQGKNVDVWIYLIFSTIS